MPLENAKKILTSQNPSLISLLEGLILLAKDYGYAQSNEFVNSAYFVDADRVLNELKKKILITQNQSETET
jgi:hypothetical protein